MPFRRHAFAGFIIGLLAQGVLHRFATYNGARIERLEVSERDVQLVVSRGSLTLEVAVARTDGSVLASPVEGAMEGRIREGVDGTVWVRLVDGGKELFSGTGTNAGLEMVYPEVLTAYLERGRASH